MSSTRNTKRKRSKAAVDPATSSTRERAADSEPAHTTTGSTAEVDNKTTADKDPSTTSINKPSSGLGNGSEKGETPPEGKVSDSGSSNQSTQQGGMKKEADAAEPMGETTGDGQSAEADDVTTTGQTRVSNDSSSSSTSSQDGASTRRQALHITNDDEDREKRIRDLISHRSVLLDRVRACKTSAERRIGTRSQGVHNNPINTDDLSDEQEIAAFRSMTKAANQAARKSRELEASAEKRTSLSLRRGSSVGKRMNAALSSLVPGSNLSSTTGLTANNTAMGHSTTGTAGHPNSDPKSEAKAASPFSTKSSGRLSTTAMSNDPIMQSSGNSTKSNKSHSPLPSQTTKQYDAMSRGRNPTNKSTKGMKMGGLQTGVGVPNALASAQNLKKNGALPMGARSASNIPGSNPLLSKQGPKVNFPEAIALREKREQIELKLQDLMERRQTNVSLKSSIIAGNGKIIQSSSYEDELTRRKATPGGVGIAKALPNKKLLYPAMNGNTKSNNGLEILPPAHLPNRRKTHWDVVLQEMAWLASDFMEERKWKLSTSRLISSNIPVNVLSDRRKRSSDVNRVVSDNVPRDLPADGSNSISVGSEDETAGKKDDETPKKRDVHRKYSVPVQADEEIAKCRSQIVSCMISKLDSAIKKGGSLESSDRHHQEALESYAASRSDILQSTSDLVMKDFQVKKDSTEDIEVDGSSDDMSEDRSTSDESSFDKIDDYIDHFHNTCNSKHKLTAKETSKALKNGKIKMTAKQKEMLEFVDKLWSAKPHAGAVISCSSITGITFGTATIIWKQRTQGSQILICPSRSLIRWKYELSRFSNIRVLTFGSSGGISNPNGDNDVAKIGSADVILCEYGSVCRLKTALSRLSANPFSVTVDLRHFASLRKSLCSSTAGGAEDFPLELMSNSWWSDLVALVRNREIRCLFLEYHDADPLSLSKCGLGQKEQIGILAKRAACLIGPEVFGSGSHSIEREVVTWARRKGKDDIVDKGLRVRTILGDALKPMTFNVAKPIISSFDLEWELRSCKMSSDQREEYERCCNEVRGALSSTIEFSNTNRYHYSIPLVSKALFRLRQECFYSQKHAMLSYSTPGQQPLDASSVSENTSSKFWGNSSQPDADKATSILESSSKLKELVSILSNEGGYILQVDETTKKAFGIQRSGKKGKDQKRTVKKIAIVAALPHIQQVVSTLLNSLGIQNELLCGHKEYEENPNCGDAKSQKIHKQPVKLDCIAWTKSQNVLSRFCGEDDIRKTNVIIASPAVLSGRNDGIGIEGADIIITLDSDWSGRDGFILSSLVRRWQAKNKLTGKEDRLIRLVSANSIEARIFDDNEGNTDDLSWPLDMDGFFTLPLLQNEASTIYKRFNENDVSSYFSFPAVGIMQHRGSLLEEVLSANHLPSLFGSGKPSLFLPQLPNVASSDQGIFADIHFLRHFLQNEATGSASTQSTLMMEPTIKYQTSCAGLTSRNDISVIGSRLFLEKLIYSHSLSKNMDDHPLAYGLQSNTLLRSDAQAPGESSSAKINENPSALLFYQPNHDLSSNASPKNQTNLAGNKVESKAKMRYNAYAKLFSSSWNGISLRDGNQGCEPLVFFPPLFPLLEEVSKNARMKIPSAEAMGSEANPTLKSELSSSQKRKDREYNGEHDAKRLKTKSASQQITNGSSAPSSKIEVSTKGSSQSPLNSADQQLIQNGLAHVDSVSSGDGLKVRTSCTSGVIMFDEDFGLLGSGAFPSPLDATSFSLRDSKVNTAYRPDDGLNLDPYDAEETSSSSLRHMEEGMESVLLFVKKRQRSTQPPYKHVQGLSSKLSLRLPLGDDSTKKIKKRVAQGNSQVPATAFSRLPASAATQLSQVLPRTSISNSRQIKGDFRHKLLSSFYARQRASGLTLFDSVPYRVAAMRVEKRVLERVEKLMWKATLALDAGPGLPIQFVQKSLSINRNHSNSQGDLGSIVDELKDGFTTGDIAITQSRAQKLEFKKSVVSPRCVDFGAFEVGYLSSRSGMIGTPTARRRVGVSLPMGVRLMKPTKDQEKRSFWNARDDEILIATVKKFGTNWLLIASATSGFEHAVIRGSLSGAENIISSVAKSARQCRDRWQLLTQSQASLVEAISGRLANSDRIDNNELIDVEEKALVYSAENIKIICKFDDFSNPPETKDLTSTKDADDAHSSNAKDEGTATTQEGEVASPRSTFDKTDDAENSEQTATQVANTSSSATEDVEMSEASTTAKPKRRSFSAISTARSRRQIFPVTIPGVDVNASQPGHPVPSHPSHMQSVQLSVAAQWASGRTEMWPLQILDLADKQRSNAARINNMQRGEIPPSHNPSRRHPSSSSSYPHRAQPSQPSAVRTVGAYPSGRNTSSRPVAPRPASSSVSPHHQHRSPTVAAATAQAYIPPQNSAAGKSKKNDVQKPSKSSPKKG